MIYVKSWIVSLLLPVGLAGAASTEIAYLGLSDGIWQVWVMAADGTSSQQVTRSPYDKTRISWYPDGDRLFVNSVDGYAYRVDLVSGHEERIKTELSGFQDAVLAPDARHFAFSLSTSGSVDANNIWVADEDGNELRKLTSMPRLQHEPVWSPDGRYIYFLSGDGGQSHDIWRTSVEQGLVQQISALAAYHFDIAVAADGTLAYSNNRDGQYDLWLRGLDGQEVRLTDDRPLDARPSWSPDTKSLIFESSRGGVLNLWVVDRVGGNPTQLTYSRGGARFPIWRQVRGGK